MAQITSRSQPAPGQAIPIPDDFPVSWDDPAGVRRLWRLDPIHYPRPLPLLEHDLHQGFDAAGSNRALVEYGFPFRWTMRNVNGYIYTSVTPVKAPPDLVPRLMHSFKQLAPSLVGKLEDRAVASMSEQYLPQLEARLDNLRAYWQDELLPATKALLARWRDFDLEGADWGSLLGHLEWTLEANVQCGYYHGLIVMPYIYGWSEFDELHNQLFPEADPFDSHKLLQGFDNKLLEGDRWLWRLGRKALTMPAVQEVLEREAAADVLAALAESAAGQVFLAELRRFITEHGHRNAFVCYSARSWHEDASPLIKLLKDYITQPERDMDVELAAEAAERERRVADARARLRGYPEPVRLQFDRLLEVAQFAEVVHADHTYWLDCACVYEVRRVMLAFGQRFRQGGVLDDRQEIMHLTLEEVRQIGADLARGHSSAGRQSLVAGRKAELARYGQIKPPPQLGTVPWLEPPADEPMFRAGQKFMGVSFSGAVDGRHNSGPPGTVRGYAGSPGVARGIAKVVRSLAEAGKLEPGDILIAETTTPPWTPLFATIAAVVTDTGGILSHCAVVAREYRIPAVVGALDATDTFTDGQKVEVDGDRGIARVLD